MLRLISGLKEPDKGSVTTPKSRAIGYLPQDLVEIENMPLINYLEKQAGLDSLSREIRRVESELSSLVEDSELLESTLARHERLQKEFDAKEGFNFEIKVVQILRGLGFNPERDSIKMTEEFSGGWKMRIALASLLLSDNDILLLDEPTNHLDSESMEWLETWLRDYKGTIIAVSHDRRFLENVVTSVVELAFAKINIFSCGYKAYLVEREERINRINAEAEQQREKINETEKFIERFRYKASKARQVQSRIKQLNKIKIQETIASTRNVNFKFPEAPRSGLNVITSKNLSKYYDDNKVFEGIDLNISRGERVALVGINGAGKSTLLRILNQTEHPSSGEIKIGHNVKKAFFSQESAENLNYERTVIEEINSADSELLEGAKRNLLGAFLFSGDDIYKRISVLSGGEKSRVALAKMLLSK